MSDPDKPAGLGPELAAAALDAALAEPIPGDDAPLAPHDGPPFAPVPPDPDDEDGEPEGEAPMLSAEEWAMADRCAQQPQNDIGNGMRLRLRCGENLSYAQRIGFFVWDERRWQEDVEGKVARPLAHKVVEAIPVEVFLIKPTPEEQADMDAGIGIDGEIAELKALDKPTPDQKVRLGQLLTAQQRAAQARKRWTARRSARRKFGVSSGNSGKIEGMLKEAAPYLSRAMDEFDTEPLALNCESGTLRFRFERVEDEESDPDDPRYREGHVVEVSPHRREDFITKLAPAAWDPDAPRPVFEAFMARILPKPEVRDFVQRYLGYCLTALTREQVFVVFHGEGRNGKSTLVDVVAKVLGDYGTTVPIATLVGDDRRKGGEATPDLVRLPGARFVRTAEPKQGMPFDESLIKALTGGEPILVRRLNQEFIEVYPTFKLVVSCNRKPEIRGDDDGIWRRVLLVPFEVQIPVEEVDKGLADKLWQERSGILAWLVEGALAYLDGGLRPPGDVRSATDEYREESDILGSFVRAALEVTRLPEDKVEAGRLYTVYENWCRLNGHTPWRAETFSRRIAKAAERHGIAKVKSSIILFTGIRVRPEFLGPAPSRTRDD